jgi:cell division protein FtsI/penicillin-binding protein 2
VPTARDNLNAVFDVNLPASTMKTLSAAYVLVRHPDAAAHEHVCTGELCSARHGQVRNLEDALNRSCNTWFRLESGSWNRSDWLAFLLNTGIEPADVPGLPTSSLLMSGHKGNTMFWPQAIGQQVWVSMVGLAAAYATVSSLDGRRVNPSVLVHTATVPDRPTVVPPAVAANIRQMLRSTARIGTGRPVNETYARGDAGGKTGTGEVEGSRSDALFVATAPWNDPRWIVAVSIKHGGTGGVAARLAGTILNTVVGTMAPAGAH